MDKKMVPVALLLASLVMSGCATNQGQSNTQNNNNSQNSASSTQNNNEGDVNDNVSHTYPIPDSNPDVGNLKTYYASIDTTKKGEALRNNIHSVISDGRKSVGYDGLFSVYKDSDMKPDGYLNDIYSCTSRYKIGQHTGNYKKEGDMYNREHTIPQSWWGKGTSNQGCDPYIVFPSDGKINGMRSSYPFGEVSSIKSASNKNYSKLGKSKYNVSATYVFEPNDQWKGDMARAYFYAVACYSTKGWTSGYGDTCFSSSGTVGLTPYARKLFMKWHLQDPVDDWEIKRNNAVSKHTKNRNPFIDHPEWACSIWGTEHFE